MRRSIVVAATAALIAAFVVSAVTLAGDSGTRKVADQQRSGDPTRGLVALAGARGGAYGSAAASMLLGGLADRLNVSEEQLRDAVPGVVRRQLDRLVARGTITDAERDAVQKCIDDGGGADCDRAQVRSAAIKVRRSLTPDGAELTRLKNELAEDAGAELGKPADEVVAAVRGELEDKLEQGVALGLVTERLRDLALRCFDTPDDCEVGEVRRQARSLFGLGWRRP